MFKQLKINRPRSGAAMITVVCYVAIATVLSLSLLLASSVIITSVRSERDGEQSRILAVSLSKEIEAQLVSASFDDSASEEAADDGSLWFYIKDAVTDGSWAYYNEDERGHTSRSAFKTLTIDPDSLSEDVLQAYSDIGKVEVLMYWESSYDTKTLDGVPLTVKVTCVCGTSTCSVTSEYTLECKYESDVWQKWSWSLTWRQ